MCASPWGDSPSPEIKRLLGAAPHQLTRHGLYCHREGIPPSTNVDALFREAERLLLARGDVRVLDFNTGPGSQAENVIPTEEASLSSYVGVDQPAGSRLFRVDHHHDLKRLAQESTTPLALAWLRAMCREGREDVLLGFTRARYLADHCDADILLANALASRADDAGFVLGRFAEVMAAAALRNDYVVAPPVGLEPEATRVFRACVGLERAVRAGEVSFDDATRRWVVAMEGWCQGRAGEEEARRLAGWEAEARDKEAEALAKMTAWSLMGRVSRRAEGRVVVLEAPSKVDNSDLFLWVGANVTPPPSVQVLTYPRGGDGSLHLVMKVRAHGGFDLNPVFTRLQERFPGAGFRGRAAAGGCPSLAHDDREPVLREVEAVLRAKGDG
jgi:hypothetical protein